MTLTAVPPPRTELAEHGELAWTITSADGQWLYERDDLDPYVWNVVHVPSGQEQVGFPNLGAATKWTATDAAIDLLRNNARDRLYPDWRLDPDGTRVSCDPGTVDRVAMRQLAILDNCVTTGTPTSVCDCGGLVTLAKLDNGDRQWMHVDLCRNCYEQPGACDNDQIAAHPMCLQPGPGQCDHIHCRAEDDLDARACDYGHLFCCGCCHGDPS